MARYIIINRAARNGPGSAALEMVLSIAVLCLVVFLLAELTAFFISSHRALIAAEGEFNAKVVGTGDPCLKEIGEICN
jgi:Flp pilus assembly protein TadG